MKYNKSSNQKRTICWSHSATPDNQTSQSGPRMDTRKWQEEGRKTKEDMARHTERRFGHTGCWLERRERYCQRSCQMETTRRPMFCTEREELSLSKSCQYKVWCCHHAQRMTVPAAVSFHLNYSHAPFLHCWSHLTSMTTCNPLILCTQNETKLSRPQKQST